MSDHHDHHAEHAPSVTSYREKLTDRECPCCRVCECYRDESDEEVVHSRS